uniref:Uncharacterized protein n=1 Tax=Cacopsylla melanoneura TaxID=428564 RepID=A0A8D8QGG6_9HEMI
MKGWHSSYTIVRHVCSCYPTIVLSCTRCCFHSTLNKSSGAQVITGFSRRRCSCTLINKSSGAQIITGFSRTRCSCTLITKSSGAQVITGFSRRRGRRSGHPSSC